MSNSELLTAISDMMDQKLEEKLDQALDRQLGKKLNPALDKQLDNKLQPVIQRLDHLEESLVPRVKNIEITLENNLIPRVSHIEQCYIDTFERYQSGISKLEEMQRDIDIIKITVTGHSEELNKITGPYLVK